MHEYHSPLGKIILLSDSAGLCGTYFENQRFFPDVSQCEIGTNDVIESAVGWLDIYFSGEAPDFTPLLHLIGTPYRRRVWQSLLTVPYGKTASYSDLAAIVGGSPRSIGGAVGHNPVSVIVPCHRIVASDGSFTGYAGGIDRKKALLNIEQA